MISSTITSGADAPAVMPRLLMPSNMLQSRSLARCASTAIFAALALGDLAQPLRVRRVRRADHDQRIDHRRHLLDRQLAVGGGVADVFLVRAVDVGKALASAPPRSRRCRRSTASFASRKQDCPASFGVKARRPRRSRSASPHPPAIARACRRLPDDAEWPISRISRPRLKWIAASR